MSYTATAQHPICYVCNLGQVLGLAVKTLVDRATTYLGVFNFRPCFVLSGNAYTDWQAKVIGFQPSLWETGSRFLTPGYSRSEPMDESSFCVNVSISVSLK